LCEGRGFPDLSSFSQSCNIVFQGDNMTIGGTSCASPTIAGIISLVNDFLLNNNKKQGNYC
jgi:tripeptidyl-peptidase-1